MTGGGLVPPPRRTDGAGSADTFDRYASHYAATVNASIAASGENVEYFADLKASLAHRAMRGAQPAALLDFGCGTGLSTRALRRAFPSVTRMIGVDPSADSIRQAAESTPAEERIAYEVSGPERLPVADATFDVVFAACVFHHIDRDQHGRWFREVERVLRPAGVFFLFEHNPYNPLTRRAVRDCPFDEGVVLLQPSYARRALRESGFAAAPPHYYFFFPPALGALRRLEPALSRVPLGAQYFVRAERRSR